MLVPDIYAQSGRRLADHSRTGFAGCYSPGKTSCAARTAPSVARTPPRGRWGACPAGSIVLYSSCAHLHAAAHRSTSSLASNRGDRRQGFSATPLKKGGFERPVAQIGPVEGGDRRITLPRKVGQAAEISERTDEAAVKLFFPACTCKSDTETTSDVRSHLTRYRPCSCATPTRCGSLRP